MSAVHLALPSPPSNGGEGLQPFPFEPRRRARQRYPRDQRGNGAGPRPQRVVAVGWGQPEMRGRAERRGVDRLQRGFQGLSTTLEAFSKNPTIETTYTAEAAEHAEDLAQCILCELSVLCGDRRDRPS